jgi:HEAT repeat protein
MSGAEVIAQAKQWLKAGKWEEAKELLIEEGFQKRIDPVIVRAYEKLIPPRAPLLEHLDKELAQLQAVDPKVRKAAADAINKQARAEGSIYASEWLADPRTTGALLNALAKEQDVLVSEALASALASICFRHMQDLRVFDPMCALLASKRMKTRSSAVCALGYLRSDDKWAQLVPMLCDKSAEVRDSACYALMNKNDDEVLPPQVLKTAIHSLKAAKKDPNGTVRAHALIALERLCG